MYQPPEYDNAAEWAQCIATQTAGGNEALLVADIDDTLLDSNAHWYALYRRIATENNNAATELADEATFKAAGPRAYIGPLVENYAALKASLIEDAEFNAAMPLLTTARGLQAHARLPHGYLSTRPASLLSTTRANLQSHGLRDAPLLLRPTQYDYAATVGYKIAALRLLRASLDGAGQPDRRIYYVDDYKQLTDDLNGQYIGITAIHYTGAETWQDVLGRIG